ncbi:MAG: hypothetical protein JWL77_1299, partial [Chthonomonadaceae bacterium]|nr:hypothetical protein [Chthonomonadaceae bacterium]
MDNPKAKGGEKPSPLPTNTETITSVVEKPIVAGGRGSDALRVGDIGPRQKRQREISPFARIFLPNRAVSGSAMGLLIL